MRFTLPSTAARSAVRRGITAVAALALAGGLATGVSTAANAAVACQVNYTIQSSWPGGFTANVDVSNLGDALTNWNLGWTFGDAGQKVTQGWNGQFSQSGQQVTVSNESWNGSVAAGGTVNVGFNGSWSGSNPVPASFTLNGTTCNGGTTPPTTAPPTTAPPTTAPPTNPPTSGTHVDNPYAGATGYVNPEWSAEASADGGSAIANEPTAVWLDSIASIEGTSGHMGLRDHLDHALEEGAGYIEFSIYDLPGRDCAALASNGELGPTEIAKYETDYIDPIAAIMSDPKYASLRIINVIEIDSLPNLVTNTGSRNTATSECDTMLQNGNYVTGIQYALNKLHAISNVYNYVDAAHHGWIGWPSNFDATATLMATTVQGTTAGFQSVDGFITNTANYSALKEPFITVNSQTQTTDWIDYNDYVDESTFGAAFRQQLISDGFPSSIGMLIDTSRNGWGGPDRPTAASTSTDPNTFVNDSRIDRRPQLGDWCNQSGAGIGERPTASPAAGFDAYVWIKPPGESDGASKAIPNDEGKGFDQMCDPNYGGNARNNNHPTGALPDAPLSGHWFSAQFHQLIANAYPPL